MDNGLGIGALNDSVILSIAKEINMSPAQVILRWLIQRNVVIIPKSIKLQRISENLNIFDFELSSNQVCIYLYDTFISIKLTLYSPFSYCYLDGSNLWIK
jgi:hypothetical protein